MRIIILIISSILVISCNPKSENTSKILSRDNDQNQNVESMENRLLNISNKFQTVKEVSLKYLKFGGKHEEDVLKIYNQKWIAPKKYAITIYGITPDTYIEKFEKDNKIEIPLVYKQFLKEMNGCFIFDFDLFGLTPSIYETGLLDRSKVQCFDLGTANRDWIFEYEIEENLFHFGGRAFSYDENVGYFMDNAGNIKSIRNNGQVINEWSDFSEFLKEEIQIAEQMMLDELPVEEKGKI